jgi:uncharacterized alpha-E superfamily protein
MLSRVADSFYWMGRYLERAEHTARVVNVNLNLTLDRAPTDSVRHWGRLIGSLPAPPAVAIPAAPLPEDPTVDLASGEAILACIAAARENARQVREQTSSEMWEQLNGLFLTVQRWRQGQAPWGSGTHEALASVTNGMHLFQGVTDATMTHGEGWHHIELGRYLERVGSTAAMLDVHYRDFAQEGMQPAGVSEYVERSIRFGAARIDASLRSVALLTGRQNGRADRLAGRLLASLDYGQIDELLPALSTSLPAIIRQVSEINAAIHQQYVAYPADVSLGA